MKNKDQDIPLAPGQLLLRCLLCERENSGNLLAQNDQARAIEALRIWSLTFQFGYLSFSAFLCMPCLPFRSQEGLWLWNSKATACGVLCRHAPFLGRVTCHLDLCRIAGPENVHSRLRMESLGQDLAKSWGS